MTKRRRDNETDLRPCPFCGPTLCSVVCKQEPADGMKRRTKGNGKKVVAAYRVECAQCGTRGPLCASPVDARRNWNDRRSDRGAVREMLDHIGDL